MSKISKDNKEIQISCIHLGFLGGLASMASELVTFPADNVKTRIQMNGRDGLPNYKSTVDCIIRTSKSKGILGFYNGAHAAVIRQALYSSVRIAIYEKLKRQFHTDITKVGYFEKLFAGGFAGAIGCIVGNPADILKIRLINDVNNTKYAGLFDAFRQIIRNDGYRGFYKGLNVNVVRAIAINAAELATYDHMKQFATNTLQLNPHNISTHFFASVIAGICAAFVSSPADVLRTRYMNHLNSGSPYSSSWDCALSILKTEGFFAFYKGVVPYFIRMGPWSVIFFLIYEQTKYAYVKLYL